MFSSHSLFLCSSGIVDVLAVSSISTIVYASDATLPSKVRPHVWWWYLILFCAFSKYWLNSVLNDWFPDGSGITGSAILSKFYRSKLVTCAVMAAKKIGFRIFIMNNQNNSIINNF